MPFKDADVRREYQRSYHRKWRLRNEKKWLNIRRKAELKRQSRWDYNPKRCGVALRRHIRQKLFVLERYGRRCKFCKDSRYEVLTIDHINGDGTKHRREIASRYRNLIDFLARTKVRKDLYRILCMGCNFAREHFDIEPGKEKYRSWDEWRDISKLRVKRVI